ncbi:MAG: tRNA (guanosine(46)-N7)-methyltransferase TrmB [Gammaproteobacteria bacterium]|nr:tRNA (guanosine(46)-N7)-methyltransferase TrmB [Gammaproteobacteria bacterium]
MDGASLPQPPMRTVRSFVRRQGRITLGQRRALQQYGEQFLLGFTPGPLDLDRLFGRRAPRVIEIGFGMGDALFDMACRHPEQDFIGIEVFLPGVGALLRRVGEQGLTNVRVISADAVQVLEQMIPDDTLSAVWLLFPDPWHKNKHHKRRLVQPDFAKLVRNKLQLQGCFHLATDWENYAQQMMKVLSAAPGFANQCGAGQFAPRPESRPLTKFERRGQRLGHGVRDLIFERQA